MNRTTAAAILKASRIFRRAPFLRFRKIPPPPFLRCPKTPPPPLLWRPKIPAGASRARARSVRPPPRSPQFRRPGLGQVVGLVALLPSSLEPTGPKDRPGGRPFVLGSSVAGAGAYWERSLISSSPGRRGRAWSGQGRSHADGGRPGSAGGMYQPARCSRVQPAPQLQPP